MASRDMEIKKRMGEFLQKKYAEFVASKGRYVSQVEFANWIGVEPYNVNQWMNANRKPTGTNVHRLAARFGPKVYDIMGQTRQMPDDEQFQRVAEHWFELPQEKRDLIMKVVAGEELTDDERKELDNFLKSPEPA
jgi:plasmid maintenance system antidote protein VapI